MGACWELLTLAGTFGGWRSCVTGPGSKTPDVFLLLEGGHVRAQRFMDKGVSQMKAFIWSFICVNQLAAGRSIKLRWTTSRLESSLPCKQWNHVFVFVE